MAKNSASVVPLTAEILAAMTADIRQQDTDEIEAATGLSISQALQLLPLDGSASAIVLDGRVLAVFGDQAHTESLGVPWLISTVHVERWPREFLRVCRPAVEQMLERHAMLANYVDARNTAAIRWLQWLGFSFSEPAPYGARGLDFRFFNMIRGE